jgi:6-pyruvoyltetrahydropterin/6-carboxytetrahydropterin synthase
MPETYLSRRAFFSSGLQLERPGWSREQNEAVWGKRARPHGHDYVLDVFYVGEVSPHDGMIVNLDELKPVLRDLLAPLDHFTLNDCAILDGAVPTLENLSRALWNGLPPRLGEGSLARVRLAETQRRWCDIRRAKGQGSGEGAVGETIMKVTTKYEFAAAHRLDAPGLSAQENTDIYGKCNNPRGHGHNYGLEVTVEGSPEERTGEIMPLQVLDALVDEEVFARFDHKHLNEDCPEFADMIPTSENLARVIFQVLEPRVAQRGCKLSRIALHETQKNYFEVEA